uniref:Uncharacterized protein n=1 Tax=Aegilops tauschii subsp. strangulata TaxID=200361 RepID=A0A453D1X7_AEGTS
PTAETLDLAAALLGSRCSAAAPWLALGEDEVEKREPSMNPDPMEVQEPPPHRPLLDDDLRHFLQGLLTGVYGARFNEEFIALGLKLNEEFIAEDPALNDEFIAEG